MNAHDQLLGFLDRIDDDTQLRAQMSSLLRCGTDLSVLQKVTTIAKSYGYEFFVETIGSNDDLHMRLIQYGSPLKPSRQGADVGSVSNQIAEKHPQVVLFLRSCLTKRYFMDELHECVQNGNWESINWMAWSNDVPVDMEELRSVLEAQDFSRTAFDEWVKDVITPSYLSILLSGADTWNEWRANHSEVPLVFDGLHIPSDPWEELDLAGVNLANASFQGTVFGSVSLRKANLANSDFSSADMRKCILSEASFRESQLSNVDLQSMDLAGCDFTGATMCNADLRSSNLTGCKFVNANLSGAIIRSGNMSHADFSSAILEGAQLDTATILQAKFVNSRLAGANIGRSVLAGSNFNGADLTSVHAWECKLNDCNLAHSVLCGAMLDFSTLHRANLQSANLSGASVRSLKLRDANTNGMILNGARHADEIWWYD